MTIVGKISVRLERYAELSGRGACFAVEMPLKMLIMLDSLENRGRSPNRPHLRKGKILFAEKRKCHRRRSRFPKLRGEKFLVEKLLPRDENQVRRKRPRTPRKPTY